MVKLRLAGVCGKMWYLINNFLFDRKVRLIFNDYIGIIRSCLGFGLPQGSCLSPILFKFYISDLLSDVDTADNVDVFKFADDGTVLVTGLTTPDCLSTLEDVCSSLNKWSNTWRMVVNCDPGKTELVCFNTAENNPGLIPGSVKIGDSSVLFVSSTMNQGTRPDH